MPSFRFTFPALMAALFLAAGSTAPRAVAQSPYITPVLPPIDYHPEAYGTTGRWSIYSPTLPGWHYSVEQLGTDWLTWEALPDGQFYGNGQPFKYFVKEGPMPSSGSAAPPPAGTSTWQLRLISYTLYAQKNGSSPGFRLQRAATVYPGPVPVDVWDATLTDVLPSMPAGTRTYLFKGWDDPMAKIMWNTEFHLIITDAAPAAESLSTTPEQAAELNVFQQVKSQLIGAITTPYTPGPPMASGPKQLIRLRRTQIDTNHNGLPDWWELANGFPALTAFNPATNDPDGDGLSTADEYLRGTNPNLADTDGDGLTDGAEVTALSDPLLFNMPEFTLVSATRSATLTQRINRPSGGTVTGQASCTGTGAGTSAGDYPSRTSIGPSSGTTSIFSPWPLPAAASAAWGSIIPEPFEPVSIHDLDTPLYASRMENMHGDGDFIAISGQPNAQEYRDITRTGSILERTVRVEATRAMKVAWRIPYTRTVTSRSSRTGQWNAPAITTGFFTFAIGQRYSSAVTMDAASTGMYAGTASTPGQVRQNSSATWVQSLFTSAQAVEWLTIDKIATAGINPSTDRDLDGISNDLEVRMGSDPDNRNSDSTGYADGDQLNKGVLPPAEGTLISTRKTEYQYSPEDPKCPQHPANRLAVETDIPLKTAFRTPTEPKPGWMMACRPSFPAGDPFRWPPRTALPCPCLMKAAAWRKNQSQKPR